MPRRKGNSRKKRTSKPSPSLPFSLTAFQIEGILLFLISLTHFFRVSNFVPLTSFLESWPLTEHTFFLDFAKAPFSFLASGMDGIFLSDRRLTALLVWAFQFAWDASTLLKIVYFALLFISPYCLYVAARLFKGDRIQALIALAIGVAGLGTLDPYSWNLIRFGHVNFVFANYLFILTLAVQYQFLKTPNLKNFGWVILSALVLGWTHVPLFWVSLIFTGLLFVLFGRTLSFENRFLFLGGFVGVGALCSSAWVMPFMMQNYYMPVDADPYQSQLQDLIVLYWPFFRDGSIPNALIRAFLLIGLVETSLRLLKKKDPLGTFFLVWIAGVAVIAFLGSHFSLFQPMGPRQFLHTFGLISIVPASAFLRSLYFRPGTIRFLFFIGILWFQLTSPLLASRSTFEIQSKGKAPFEVLLGALGAQTARGGILFEDTFDRESVFVAGQLLRSLTSYDIFGPRQYFSKAKPVTNPTFGFEFKSKEWRLSSKRFSEYTRKELKVFMEQLAVSHIVTFSPQPRHLFDQFPTLFLKVPHQEKGVPNPFSVKVERRLIKQMTLQGHPGGFQPRPEKVPFQIYRVKKERT